MHEIIEVYITYIEALIPWAIVFGFGNLAVSTILRAAFGGRLVLK